ncbi:MAG: BlaI/MecI/CopY family transcriptional regulator [Lawsonibacter sp.]|jgi:BlaI family penicillinase repressor
MERPIGRLPDGELEVMQAVWRCTPPVTRGEIETVLAKTHPLASTTILTLLTRLTQRGALQMEKRGRSNVYTPTFTQQAYLAAQSGRFFRKLCGGDLRLFASALCDSGLSREEVEQLRQLLDEDGL